VFLFLEARFFEAVVVAVAIRRNAASASLHSGNVFTGAPQFLLAEMQ
jgi:hypothetical protein